MIKKLKNTVQEYDWGSLTAIPALLGTTNAEQKPQAELWMGAHPKAPSLVDQDHQWISLLALIESNPQEFLGKTVAEKFNNRLPYLFKVLAAAKPLSIQAHPSLAQAREGFARENTQGIPLDASHRNYKDDNHKPECICALTSFWAMCGFRQISQIVELGRQVVPDKLSAELDQLESNKNSESLKRFFSSLMNLAAERRKRVVQEAAANAQRYAGQDPVFDWMRRLENEYPEDIGILSPILLNLIHLEPGQALFLSAQTLHAYLSGTGIELMANSDNVLRGGLTPKHVDVTELSNVLEFEALDIDILKPQWISKVEKAYLSPAEEFVLSVIELKEGEIYIKSDLKSAEILLCTQGQAVCQEPKRQNQVVIRKGESVIIPAAVNDYRIKGQGTLYKAAVPV